MVDTIEAYKQAGILNSEDTKTTNTKSKRAVK
jgi:hypothetical protein